MNKSSRVEEPLTENLDLVTSQLNDLSFEGSFCLVVMTGPNKGAVHNLALGKTTLGRSERADLPVSGKGISRIHATLELSPDGIIRLTDSDSTNGVFHQGARVIKVVLQPGDVFGLGPELKLRLESTDGGLHELIGEMYRSSKVDSLTNLLNRRAFEERMDEEFSVTRRHGLDACLAIIDVDHFKSVNDNYGHDAGDEVLRTVAAILKEKVRTGDLVGRWGGEEFVVFVRQADLEGAKVLLDRLRVIVSETEIPVTGGHKLKVTFSGGLVSLSDCADWREALNRADEALYRSKENGRNQVTGAAS